MPNIYLIYWARLTDSPPLLRSPVLILKILEVFMFVRFCIDGDHRYKEIAMRLAPFHDDSF